MSIKVLAKEKQKLSDIGKLSSFSRKEKLNGVKKAKVKLQNPIRQKKDMKGLFDKQRENFLIKGISVDAFKLTSFILKSV